MHSANKVQPAVWMGMMAVGVVWSLAGRWAWSQPPAEPAGAVPPGHPAPREPQLQQVLDQLRQRAEAQRQEDEQRAWHLLRQARAAESQQRLADAARLAQQAQRLAPEAPEVRDYHRQLQQKLSEQRRQKLILTAVADCLEEALDRSASLRSSGRSAEADDLADAVRQILSELPELPQLEEVRKRAEASPRVGPGTEEPIVRDEDIPPPQRISPPPASRNPEREPPPLTREQLRKALNVQVSLNWQALPLPRALEELSAACGAPIRLDPVLEPAAATVAVTLRVEQASVERVLRWLGEMTGGAYVLHQGQVIWTTKGNALEFAVTGNYGWVAPVIPARPVSAASPSKRAGTSAAKVPHYLQSGQALREHVLLLLDP
jgi:hypothetical protein